MKSDVQIRVRCALPERLLQRAMEAGICFHTAAPSADHLLTVTMPSRDAAKFLALCERFSISAQVTDRRGGSALMAWLRHRWTVLVGLMLGIAVCGLLLSRIWKIDIRFTGDAAHRGSEGEIAALLNEMDIRPGIPRNLDAAALSEALRAQAEGYSYVGARVEGVRLLIEAAPEVEAPEVYDLTAPRNLYASRDGIVVSVNAEAGQPCVKPGDAVRRGQLLIRGEEKISKEETHPIAALGQVMVRAWFEGEAEGRVHQAQVRYTGRQSVSALLETPWFEIPILEGEVFESQAETVQTLPIGGLYLPVKLTRVIARETRLEQAAGDRSLLEKRLSALALADARARLALEGPARAELQRAWVKIQAIDDDRLRASAVCEILTDAATPQPRPYGG